MRHIKRFPRPYLSNVFALLALLACCALSANSQSALDGFDPNANGTIEAVVVQPDGKILIGGSFTTLSPNGGPSVTRNRIARLNPDGTLDAAFDPNANNTVYAIAVQADGQVLAGGTFTTIGGQTRNKIARLDVVTGLADSFDPNANGFVRTMTLQADGKILVGGGIQNIGGQARNYIARLDPVTGLADSFDPHSNSLVLSIVVQADGKILVGGAFAGANSIGGQTRNHIARLDPITGLADSFDPNAAGLVHALAIQADGKILAGGTFSSIGGQTRIRIARLDAATGLADSFNPTANNQVLSIAVQADGKILAGGGFTTIGGQARNHIARLDTFTGLADAFDPNASNTVNSIAVQQHGMIIVGGLFTSLSPNGGAPVTRNRIARLETDGRLDRTLDLGIVGNYIVASAVQPDGKILIGGKFTSVLGVARNNIARLNSDGTLDAAFNPNADSDVRSIAVQADGNILVGGTFGSIGGQVRNYIARLDAVTGLADSWNPNSDHWVLSFAVQADGKILVCGRFTSIGGQPRHNIARLDVNTGSADSFDPNANDLIGSIAVQADGKILAGGHFTIIGGQARNRIARLNPDGTLDTAFDPNANNFVYAIAVQPDGKILVGGAFFGANSIGGQTRNRVARLDPATGLADSFNPNASFNFVSVIAVQSDGKILVGGDFDSIGGWTRSNIARLNTDGTADWFNPFASNNVYSIGLLADGKILAGGLFDSIGGQMRSLFARLDNDTVALQNLSVTQTDITWIRSGSSPQFTRVTFESSTDNMNYSLLGNGTLSGSNWTLTGLTLATGVNLYIRAHGYYHSGGLNGSQSIQESVRNVFIVPTITGTITYGNAIGAPTPRFVSNVLISGSGSVPVSTFSSFPNGTYSLSGFGSGAYTVTPSKTGGVNGSITSFDAGKIAQHVAGIPPGLNPTQLIVADVTGNGTVSSFDAAQIARYAASIGGSGSTGNWIFMPVNRSYASVTSNITGQDFIALLMGEVSGNWMDNGSRTNRQLAVGRRQ